jgi:hypothetical protein
MNLRIWFTEPFHNRATLPYWLARQGEDVLTTSNALI